MLTAPASVHVQVSELVTGKRQRLGYTATTAVGAHARLIAVRTSLCSPASWIALPHGALMLTHLVCAYDPDGACAGVPMRGHSSPRA